MKSKIRYPFFVIILVITGISCNNRKVLDRRVSLWRMDKIPYGTKYAYDNLPFIFPVADIRTGYQYPVLFQPDIRTDTSRALIIIGPDFNPDPEEMNDIIHFAANGNQVFISSLYFADTVMEMLHLKWAGDYYAEGDSTEMSLLNPINNEWVKYTYPGYSRDVYFTSIDTGYTTILGKDNKGRPDFIRIPYMHGGVIYLHLNPLAFSNFFLLYKKNKTYYDIALSYISGSTGIVEWSDYFRYTRKEDYFSSLRFILSNRSLRWAFWLTMWMFFLIFTVESKRKQRAIQVVPAVRNASEDFVKTVGRLYFQQKNNQNLAAKMVAAFLEHIRSAYNLPTTVLNTEFAQNLAYRTGRPEHEISQLFQQIHEARINPDLSDQELMDLHQQIDQFTKRA